MLGKSFQGAAVRDRGDRNKWVCREQQVKQVNYAGASRVLTGDVIADAVIRYAAALHQSRLSDVVSIPTVDEYGQIARVEVLLAPGIAVAVEPAPDDALEPEDDELLRELEQRAQAVLAFTPPMSPRRARRVPPEPLHRRMIRAVGLERTGGR